ncbi:MAG: hypothetical protein Q4B86_07215 [Eubacteriales bacterium]|nr:hypothetical protein [Eubacteriales bacterium]
MKLYTSKVIAQWIGLTERRVRQLRDEGIIDEVKPGLYDLKASILKYIKFLGGTGKESLQTERMKLTAEKRKAAELDNAIRYGNLHKTEDIELALKTLFLNMRSRFLALPTKLSSTISTMDGDQSEIADLLREAINEILEEFSNYDTAFEVNDDEEND